MTDIEITRKCAEAIGLKVRRSKNGMRVERFGLLLSGYNPLRDDAQAMELVKKIGLSIERFTDGEWQASYGGHWSHSSDNEDLNRAICLCVANMKGK